MTIIRTPDIKKAVEMYYAKPELLTSDICELFGCKPGTARRIKNEVKEIMARDKVHCWTANAISTKVAYKHWGIDVEDYEKRLMKLRKLGLEGTA